jgi:hypothetical protein
VLDDAARHFGAGRLGKLRKLVQRLIFVPAMAPDGFDGNQERPLGLRRRLVVSRSSGNRYLL